MTSKLIWIALALAAVPAGAQTAPGTLWIGNDMLFDVLQTDTKGNVQRTLTGLPVTGVAFDGSSLYFGDTAGTITRRTLDGAVVLGSFSAGAGHYGEDMAWDSKRKRLWRVHALDNLLLAIDPATGRTDSNAILPSTDPQRQFNKAISIGIAYDSSRDLLYVSFCEAACSDFTKGLVRTVNPDTGAVTGELFRSNGFLAAGLAYDPATDTLWAGSATGVGPYAGGMGRDQLGPNQEILNLSLSGAVLARFPRPKVGGMVDGLEFVPAAPAPPGAFCNLRPRNAFIPGHLPHATAGAHSEHTLSVDVTLDGAPAKAVDVTLDASRPAFTTSASEAPTLTRLTRKTDDVGRAVFAYDPSSPEAFDRTDFTASGTAGGKPFLCRGAVLVGIGALSGPLLGFRTGTTAVGLLERSKGEQLAWSARYAVEIRKLLLAHPSLLRRAQRGKAQQALIRRIIDRPAEGFDAAELTVMAELLKRLEAHAGGELRKSLARLARPGGSPAPEVERPVRGVPAGRAIQAGLPPLGFELNQGQTDGRVRYLARGPGYSFYLTPADTVLVDAVAAVRMQFAGANRAPRLTGLEELPGKSHYLIGSDPARWRLNVPQYGKVRYEGVYPGIDLVFHGRQRRLEFDFIVSPGADPGSIGLEFPAIDRIEPDRSGAVVLRHRDGSLRLEKPFVYQEFDGVRRSVRGRYVAKTAHTVGFEIAGWDRRHAVVIDPVLSYSSFLGGGSDEMGMAIAVDAQGNAYVTGATASANFPVSGAQPRLAGPSNLDGFVTKLSADGSRVIYSTYLGGSGLDTGLGIAVDAAGSAYVTGATSSSDFPLAQPLQRFFGGGSRAFPSDGFVAKLTPDGSGLVYSTYLGGSEGDTGKSIAVDREGNAYVAGFTASTNFAIQNPLQAKNRGGGLLGIDAFVAKLNAAGTGFVYSTYLGGANEDVANAIAVDASGNAYVAGVTQSRDFPTRNALQAANRGFSDAFLAKLNPSGSELVFSTYLGGESFDVATALALDASGSVYLAGTTGSLDFPLLNPAQGKPGASDLLGADAFLTKLDGNGSRLAYSTYLGGRGVEVALAVAVGSDGSAYVAGETDSPDFPAAGAIQRPGGGNDGFVVKLNPAGSTLAWSTTVGGRGHDSITGMALDGSGGVFLTGSSLSGDFPVTLGASQPAMRGRADALVLKIVEGKAPPRVASVSAATFEAGAPVAPGSIVTGFGEALASRLEGAASLPLPTVLDGVSVRVKDAAGTERLAPLFLVSPGQINFLMPEGAPLGLHGVTVTRGDQALAAGTVRVEAVAPGLFAANASGRGVAAASAVRVAADGAQSGELVYQCGTTQGSCVPAPIDLETGSVYLTLFGTGIRGRTPGSPLTAIVGREEVPVVYAGAQGDSVGLDQVNLGPLPRTLIGRGEVDVVVTIEGKKANTVTVGFK